MAAHPATELVGLVMVTLWQSREALGSKHTCKESTTSPWLARSCFQVYWPSHYCQTESNLYFRDKGEGWSRDTRGNEKTRGRKYPISRLSWAGLGVTGGCHVTLSLHTLIRGAEAMWSPTNQSGQARRRGGTLGCRLTTTISPRLT